MHFTVVKLFNHKSFGLDAPHYAVVADMPADMGGGQRVVDMFAAAEVDGPERLCEAFTRAKNKMPHRVSPDGGGEIDFYGTDYKGNSVKQNTAYVPGASLTGETFEENLLNWLSWRARVGLWLQDRKRPALSEKTQARILETVVSPQTLPEAAAILPPLTGLSVRVVPQNPQSYMADKPSAPLTQRPAPL